MLPFIGILGGTYCIGADLCLPLHTVRETATVTERRPLTEVTQSLADQYFLTVRFEQACIMFTLMRKQITLPSPKSYCRINV